jgi:transmembrane sensor
MSTSDAASAAPSPAPIPPLDWALKTGHAGFVIDGLKEELKTRRKRRMRAVRRTAAAAAVIGLAFWLVPLVHDTGSYSTPASQRRTVALADGTTVELSAKTILRADFRHGRRETTLERGEAFFSVARDSSKPFLVHTSQGTIRVLGPSFVVCAGDHTTVTLLDGSVAFGSEILSPGQQCVSGMGGPHTLSPAELSDLTSWRTGTLSLDGLTLDEATARVAAYHGRVIRMSPDLARLRVAGSCPLDDLDGYFGFLRETFGIRARTLVDGSIELTGR